MHSLYYIITFFNIAYGEIKRKQLAELKQFLSRETKECTKLKSSKIKFLQPLNSLNETHTELMESFLKLNKINSTYYNLDNQESIKILTYLKYELTDIDLEFKNRQVIGNCIIRLSTEEVVACCNLLEAIEEWIIDMKRSNIDIFCM